MKLGVKEKKESLPIIVNVKWVDGMSFVASDSQGHSIVMDTSREHGGEGSGFSPMQLLLAALGGCTGMDVVSTSKKQRQKLTGLEIHVSGERVAEYPKVYGKVHVEYRLKGEELKEKAVQRAIQLSQDVYCSVGATIKKTARLSHDYRIQ